MRTGSPQFVERQDCIVRRDQLEHLIRAAGDLLGDDTIIVIGSQAILASVPEPADDALFRSMEADLLPMNDADEAKADLIDGVLGAGSMFDAAHGVHADGVSITTPVLPVGWRERLVEIVNANTNGVRGLCLEPHDLVISKLAAGRPKDVEFSGAAVRLGVVHVAILRDRLRQTDLSHALRKQIEGRIAAWEPH
jgi:hypothetical protein